MSTNDQVSTTSKVKRYFGQGTYGIIIGCPRLPSENEPLAELKMSESSNNEVSKVIKDADDIKKLYTILDLIHQRFSPNNLAQLRNQIVIPSRPQLIDWHALGVSPEEMGFLRSHKITKRRYKWHYLMERGTVDLDEELRTVKTLNQFKHFLKGFSNIIDGIAVLHSTGLVHTDIKLTNMIVSLDGRYKVIDLDELGDTTCYPSDKSHFEKIYNNLYYPYYSPAGAFLWAFTYNSSRKWNDKFVNVLLRDLVKKNYDKDYYHYFTEISKNALLLANDAELTRIIQDPYANDQAMLVYLRDFLVLIDAQPDRLTAHRELLLFIDRYALGINLLILLTKYYKITGQIPGTPSNTTIPSCEFISQSLVKLIKLCCNPANYSVITTEQIAKEYRGFITQLFRSYPFKFIIKFLSGLSTGIRHRNSQV